MSQLSVWKLTHHISSVTDPASPWINTLQAIAEAVLVECAFDAVWLFTILPFPPAAAGVFHPIPNTNPDFTVYLADESPPSSFFPFNSPPNLLKQALESREIIFPPQNTANKTETPNRIDGDLADTIMDHTSITPQAIVPLIANNTPCGVMIIGSHSPTPSTAPDWSILPPVADHIALILTNAHLTCRAKKQTEQLTAFNTIAQTITLNVNIDQALQKSIAGINRILEVEAGALLLLDPASDELYFKLILRGAETVTPPQRLHPGEGIAGWVAQNSQPALVNSVATDPRFSKRIDQITGLTTRSVLCSPIIVNGKTIGVLEVLNKAKGGFSLGDQTLLESITATLGITIYNAQLHQNLQIEAEQTAAINTLVAAINAESTLTATLSAIAAQLSHFFEFHLAIIGLPDQSCTVIQNTVFDHAGTIMQTMLPVLVENSVLHQLTSSNLDLLLLDLAQTAPAIETSYLAKLGMKHSLVILLAFKHSCIGLLILAGPSPIPFTAQHRLRIPQVTTAISTTLEKMILLKRLEQKAYDHETLNLLGERLLIRSNPRLVFETALDYIPRLVPADVHGLMIIQPDSVTAGLRLPANAPETMIENIKHSMLTNLNLSLTNTSVTKIDHVYQVWQNPPVSTTWQPLSILAWPILTRRGSLGLVYLAYGYEFTISGDLMRLFAIIVSRIAGAVENAYLFAEVEQEQATLLAILASTPDGILVINREERVMLDNPAARHILGHSTSQQGKPLTDVVTFPSLLALFNTARLVNQAADEIVTRNNETFYTTIAPVKTSTGTIIGWVAVMQNVTHFKELDEAKDDFVNTVSHDLRSPLASILIASQLLQTLNNTDAQQSEMLSVIEKHVNQMSQLIDDLLDVGKIEANIDMEMTSQSLDFVISEVIDQLQEQAQQKQIAITVEISPQTEPTLCNATRIQQVMTNLVSNAIKYTPEAGQITVKLFPHQQHLYFQVIDTGVGIPLNDQPHIFEKFYRVRGDHMLGKKGTGLGLSIAKAIIEKHNGKIWVESKFGQGSTFTFSLPMGKK